MCGSLPGGTTNAFRILGKQPRSSGAVDEVLDRGGRPFCAAAGRALVKPLKLAGDLAKREIRVRGMDTGNKRHQPALWSTGSPIVRVSGHLQRLRDWRRADFQTQRTRINDRLDTLAGLENTRQNVI